MKRTTAIAMAAGLSALAVAATAASTPPRPTHFRALLAVLRRPRTPTDVVPRSLDPSTFPVHTGALPRESRRVATPDGPVYLVPTTTGCLWVIAREGGSCDQLLVHGIQRHFGISASRIRVFGIAADAVARIELVDLGRRRDVPLRDNVFSLSVRIAAKDDTRPYGSLVVHYRDDRPPAVVSVR